MVLGIIFVALLVIGILLFRIGDHNDFMPGVIIGITGIIFGSIGSLAILIMLTTLKSDFEFCEAEYYNLKHQVEYVNKDDVVTSENLRNQVLRVNNTIDHHRIYHKNIFVGDFYSEKIGNLPKLEWRSN